MISGSVVTDSNPGLARELSPQLRGRLKRLVVKEETASEGRMPHDWKASRIF